MAAGCGQEYLAAHDPVQVERALRGQGLELCEALEAESAGPVAVERRSFVVGLSCGEDDDLATVEVVAWPDEAARDRALREFDVQARPTARNHGLTWELGLLTVSVEGERDDEVVELVAGAMDALGAS